MFGFVFTTNFWPIDASDTVTRHVELLSKENEGRFWFLFKTHTGNAYFLEKLNRGNPCDHSVNIVNKQSVISHVLLPLEYVERFDNDLGSQ